VTHQSRIAACLLALVSIASARADDWPAFRHDNRRSGRTDEAFDAKSLRREWVWQSPAPPQPAWAGPAKWDAYAGLRGLRGMRNYDPVFHPIAVGDAVYFGSSADDSVYCLDAATGRVRWVFTTEGPVRIAPAMADGKLYFGSDDGHAYCLDAANGTLIWKHCPVPDGRRPGGRQIVHNGRLIPLWPCRTGVLVADGTAYFAAGMLPWKESYLCAVDAATGRPDGPGRYVQSQSGPTMEGALLATSDKLFSPQGRVPPLVFDRADGKSLGALQGGGGCFALITHDDHVLHGPGNKAGWITDSDAKTRAKIAVVNGGNEMVVCGDVAYVLTDDALTAVERSSRKTLWSQPCACPYALIMAGRTLLAGGRDLVAAYSADDGKLLCEAEVRGKAYGLAVAGGRLLVGTGEGAVYCFSPGKEVPPVEPADASSAGNEAVEAEDLGPLRPVEPIEDEDLLGRWVFQGELVKGSSVKDLAGSLDGRIAGTIKRARVDDVEALATDGTSNTVLVTDDHNTAKLPETEITAEAWVRVDRPLTWGGIVGAMQDNGSYERGWILGYNNSRYSLAVCGKEGPGRLTYLAADADFQPRAWAHVVGTYDGAEMKLYVDGRLRATSAEQKGPINYPPKTFYEIGAYHDQDENFRLAGMIHEVRVYRRVLSAEEVQKHYETKHISSPPPLPEPETATLAVGPCLQFTGPDSAVVRWQTHQPSPTSLECGFGDDVQTIEDPAPKKQHEAVLKGLRRDTPYEYVIQVTVDGQPRPTAPFECDTFFNYSPAAVPERPNAYPKDDPAECGAAARRILTQCGARRGICLLIGDVAMGRLAYELTRQSDLRVVVADTDDAAITSARDALHRAGVYGSRVTVHRVESLEELPFPDGFANVVVPPADATWQDAWFRLACPDGGSICRRGSAQDAFAAAGASAGAATHSDGDWLRATRPPLDGAGVWSHQYGRADNSAYGGESLGGAQTVDDLKLQWIGRPGPRAQPDRNGRKPSPLSTGGRLFMQGLQRMVAIDACNGSILWSLEVPPLMRFNMPRDCGNWCADRSHVFAAIGGKCWQIDAAAGEVVRQHDVIPGPNEDWTYDWGYLARHGDAIVGSAVKAGTSWTNFWGKAGSGWYDSRGGPVTDKICSDNLFALDGQTGGFRWEYRGGLIVNPTITIGDGRIYFVECRNDKAIAAPTRRLGGADFWQDQFLVALDLKSGELWEQPLDVADGVVVFFLAYSDGKLVLVSSDTKYHVYAFDAADGKPAWQAEFNWPSDNHGKHMSRPAIAGGRVFVRPHVFDLADGKQHEKKMPDGGCGTYALSDEAVFFRAGNVTMWNEETNRTTAFHRLRPGCWLSTIPAAGMLLSPEAGGGCSCGNWLETSAGFMR